MSQGQDHIYSEFSEEPPRDEMGRAQVDLSEEDPPEPGEPRETRRERKNLRSAEHQLEEQRQRTERLESELRQANERFTSFAATVMNRGGQQRAPVRDPYEVQLQELESREEEVLDSWQNAIRGAGADGLSSEQQREWQRKLRNVQDQRQDVLGERAARRTMQFTGQQQQGLNPQQAATLARLQAEFPDVMGNQQAVQFAVGTWNREISAGSKDDWNTVKKAMEETMVRFNMGAPPVSDGTRRRHMGQGGGGSGRGPQEHDDRVSLSPSAEKMAMAAFPDLSPREALKKWSKQRRALQQRQAG